MTHTIYKVGVCIDFKGGHFGQNNVILVIYFSDGWLWGGCGVEIIANTDNSDQCSGPGTRQSIARTLVPIITQCTIDDCE